MRNRDEYFMRLAIKKARQGVKKGQTPFGACIVKKGEVIGLSHNAVWQNTDITAHAEIQAIRKACKNIGSVDLKGSTIYSTCEPCPMCFAASHWANIKEVVYGVSIKEAQGSGFNELTISNQKMKTLGQSKIIIAGGLLKRENEEVFELWKELEMGQTY